MDDGIGLAENMLGMPGLVVLDVEDVPGEVVIQAEVTRSKATCPSCRRRAQAHDRVEVHLRELHCFGRPTRDPKASLDVSDQRVHQEDLDREADGYRPAHLPTTSAGVEATRQVGQLCRSVSGATEYTNLDHYKLRGSPPRRRRDLASADPAATDHFNTSPLKPEEPVRPRLLERKS